MIDTVNNNVNTVEDKEGVTMEQINKTEEVKKDKEVKVVEKTLLNKGVDICFWNNELRGGKLSDIRRLLEELKDCKLVWGYVSDTYIVLTTNNENVPRLNTVYNSWNVKRIQGEEEIKELVEKIKKYEKNVRDILKIGEVEDDVVAVGEESTDSEVTEETESIEEEIEITGEECVASSDRQLDKQGSGRVKILCKSNNNEEFVVIKKVSKANRIVKGYEIIMRVDGMPKVGLKNSILIRQNQAINVNENTLQVMKDFDAVVTEEMIKQAVDNLRDFIDECSEDFDDNTDCAIDYIYKEVIKTAIQYAGIEQATKDLDSISRNYWYNPQKGYIEISTEAFKSILEDIGVDASVKMVGSKLKEWQYILGYDVIKSNGSRTQLNKSGNRRVMHFIIHNELLV